MTFKIEKELRWNPSAMASTAMYYVWADNQCLQATTSEEKANKVFEAAKKDFVKNTSEIIREEEVKP